MDDLAGSRRNLLVVERDEDVLRVAAVDPVSLAVEHVDVDEVREGIDRAVRAHSAGTADDPAAGAGDQLDPDLVGINGSLAEGMADCERADDDLDQVLAAGFRRWEPRGGSGPRSLPSITPPSRRPKISIRTFLSLKKRACRSTSSLFPSRAARPVLAPRTGDRGSRGLPCRRSPWRRSRSRASAPCGTRCNSTWPLPGSRSCEPRGRRRLIRGRYRSGSGRGRSLCSG